MSNKRLLTIDEMYKKMDSESDSRPDDEPDYVQDKFI